MSFDTPLLMLNLGNNLESYPEQIRLSAGLEQAALRHQTSIAAGHNRSPGGENGKWQTLAS